MGLKHPSGWGTLGDHRPRKGPASIYQRSLTLALLLFFYSDPDITFSIAGALPGYHSEFALVPDYSYGIIVLMTGTYGDTLSILLEAAKHVQYAMTRLY